MPIMLNKTNEITDDRATFTVASISVIAFGNVRVYIDPCPCTDMRYTVTMVRSCGVESLEGKFKVKNHALSFAYALDLASTGGSRRLDEWQQ